MTERRCRPLFDGRCDNAKGKIQLRDRGDRPRVRPLPGAGAEPLLGRGRPGSGERARIARCSTG
jgi:hypothetical protein